MPRSHEVTNQKTSTKAKDAAEQAEADKTALAKPWMGDDYTGPLTADQAAWRHANIKPVRDVETK